MPLKRHTSATGRTVKLEEHLWSWGILYIGLMWPWSLVISGELTWVNWATKHVGDTMKNNGTCSHPSVTAFLTICKLDVCGLQLLVAHFSLRSDFFAPVLHCFRAFLDALLQSFTASASWSKLKSSSFPRHGVSSNCLDKAGFCNFSSIPSK